MTRLARLFVALALCLLACVTVLVAGVRTARADRRTDAAARDAITRAEGDFLNLAFDKALQRLRAAERACGEKGCATENRAALVRDMGVMQLRLDQRDAALASFRRAKKLSPDIALNPNYVSRELREAWDAATPTPQPLGGDFAHTPPREAALSTPLAIYLEPRTSETLASVVVRYRAANMTSFRRAPLKRMGEGWGGYIPCADVVPGTLRYYIQGFDKDAELVASAGDPTTSFTVPVRESLSGEAATLPGEAAPKKCGEEDLADLELLEGERCREDRQCKSGSCTQGRCRAPAVEQSDAPADWARLWIGVSGSLDITSISTASDVCNPASGAAYSCTTPDGNDYPSASPGSPALVAGHGGTPASQIASGGAHVTGAVDYAVTGSFLLGARFGYVFGAYPGSTAKAIGAPVHAEVRGTWVFGHEPLARPGLAAYAFLGAGVARFDTPATVSVRETNIPGDRAIQAWRVAGPAFAALGGGARYQFSQRIAASCGVNVTAAMFPGTFGLLASPELALQYGF